MLRLRTRSRDQRGAVLVLFAIALPLVLLIGVLSVDVGNWWVHKKRAQTLVDAAVFAGGSSFNGCGLDPAAANATIAQTALNYAGDRSRDSATRNTQEQEPEDLHVVLNSNAYWSGNPYPADNTLGAPCSVMFLDAKATDDDAPLLFGFIPFVADPQVKARIEIRQVKTALGPLPFGVPEIDPEKVAAIFVDEDVSASSPASVSGASWLNQQALPQGDPLSVFNTWRGDMPGVDLNGNENFGLVILATRDVNASLTGSLQTICNQNALQTTCYAGGTSTSGLSFIHSYSDSGAGSRSAPFIRQVELAGGCGQSSPYFNLDDGISCNAILIQAKIDFGASGNPTLYPTCATVSSSPGGTMTWSPGGLGGADGTWSSTFTPAIESGGPDNEVDLSWSTDKAPPNCGGAKNNGSFGRVARPYVADAASGPVQHLTVENLDPPFGFANSINGNSSANVRVTVGLIPPLKDAPLNAPPIRLRIRSQSSSGQAVACDGNGASQWRSAIINGCQTAYQVNTRNGSCVDPDPVPPDCVAEKTGNIVGPLSQGMNARFASPCTTNNWDGVQLPIADDPRWVVLFVTDEKAFAKPGKLVFPIRRFARFYVTAADGMGCPGDNPSSPGQANVWGHFNSYVSPNFGHIPGDPLCTFDATGLCVAVLVE